MRHPLPYAFARSHQLLLEDDGQQLTLWHSDQPDPGAWGEVLRLHPVRQWQHLDCLLYTSPSPRDRQKSRMPSSA